MPNLNIRLELELMRAVNMEALRSSRTQKDWVIMVLKEAVGWDRRVEGENSDVSEPR